MSYQLYDSWTIEESNQIGQTFTATCHANYGYEGHLTVNKDYLITIEKRIMPMSPLCSFIDDKGRKGMAHLTRFTKIL